MILITAFHVIEEYYPAMEAELRDRFTRFFTSKREVVDVVPDFFALQNAEEEAYTSVEIAREHPLRVRGHHFKVLQEVLHSDDIDTFGVRKFVNIHSRFLEAQRDHDEKAIYPDTIGNTPEQENRFKRENIRIYSEFMALPDEAAIELVEGQKDMVCGGCVFGKHCNFRSHEEFGMGPDVLADDMRGLDTFLEKAQYFRERNLNLRYEIAEFKDADPEKVRVIETTVGTVKHILRRTAPQDWE